MVLHDHGYQRTVPASLLTLPEGLPVAVADPIDAYGPLDEQFDRLRSELASAQKAQGQAKARNLWEKD
jgi:hypothetical protein